MRRWFAVVLILISFRGYAQDALPLWFDALPGEIALSTDEAQALANVAAARLYAFDTADREPLSGSEPRAIIFTVRDGDTLPTSVVGFGIGYVDAIESALARLPAGAMPERARLDLVTVVERERLTAPEFSLQRDPAEWGVAFSAPELGVITAAELTLNTLLTPPQDLNREAWLRFEARRGDDSEALNAAFSRSPLTVYRFQTLAFDLTADGAHAVSRTRLFPQDLTPELLIEAAHAGGSYLERAVDDEGRFLYSYDAGADAPISGYNILRHAGTSYSMLELYRHTQDTGLLSAAERALAYLTEQIEPCAAPVSNVAAGCLLEAGEVKLGGAGLALLAYSEYSSMTGNLAFLDTMRGLAAWIAGAQYPDGRFVHKLEDGAIDDFESLYYPGEAIFGLMRLYAIDPDPRWLAAARAGADYIILVRDLDTPSDNLEHDHWFLYALDALHRVDPQPHDLVHLRRLVLEILSAQHLDSVPDTWLGGYYNPPRSTPTATRSEGLCAAARLLRDLGDTRTADTVFEAVLWGISFQLQTQIASDDTLYLANPARALGGFRESLLSGEVRIDYVQHNISAILCAYDGLTP